MTPEVSPRGEPPWTEALYLGKKPIYTHYTHVHNTETWKYQEINRKYELVSRAEKWKRLTLLFISGNMLRY